MDSHDFGWALRSLKEGKKVTRSGWNGEDMWIVMMATMTIPAGMVNERTRRHVPAEVDVPCGAYIVMWTAQRVWQPGWLASQADILAEDWTTVE